ncbi:hypothetical protein AFK68_21975 [Hydrocoleum sp. CS-953]|nr:hypothetical protein AFK68_21975 [Hydrocoleum sp. CS-953]
MTYQKPPGSLVILKKTSRNLIIKIPSLDSSKSGQIFLCFMAVLVCLIKLFILRVFSRDRIESLGTLLGLFIGNLVYLPF